MISPEQVLQCLHSESLLFLIVFFFFFNLKDVDPLCYIYLGVFYNLGDLQGLDSIQFSSELSFGDYPIFGLCQQSWSIP